MKFKKIAASVYKPIQKVAAKPLTITDSKYKKQAEDAIKQATISKQQATKSDKQATISKQQANVARLQANNSAQQAIASKRQAINATMQSAALTTSLALATNELQDADKEIVQTINNQNEKLTELQRRNEVEYTKQKYKLDQIQKSMFWNKFLWMAYYILVAILGIFMVQSGLLVPNAFSNYTSFISAFGKSIIVVISAILFPYVIYPIETWIWSQLF